MREILFRGKRIDNGKWVEGYYASFEQLPNSCIYYVYKGHTLVADVDPETVCQYTGLINKNGKRIFEGDILFHSEVGNIKVQFKNSEFKAIGITHDMFSTLLSSVYKHCDIIGNIFDNTELIGE